MPAECRLTPFSHPPFSSFSSSVFLPYGCSCHGNQTVWRECTDGGWEELRGGASREWDRHSLSIKYEDECVKLVTTKRKFVYIFFAPTINPENGKPLQWLLSCIWDGCEITVFWYWNTSENVINWSYTDFHFTWALITLTINSTSLILPHNHKFYGTKYMLTVSEQLMDCDWPW